jgi:hypothetical protein
MKSNTGQPEAPDTKGDLKSLPLAEVEKPLESSQDGFMTAKIRGRVSPHVRQTVLQLSCL